jgi:metal-sulfur cluster biosynthetic enzyme
MQIEPAEARRVVQTRRCSDCWEILHEQFDFKTRTSTVSCTTPGCPCRGHVSIGYVENALAESRLKRSEAERVLGESGAVPWIVKPARQTEEAIMAELGFKNRKE